MADNEPNTVPAKDKAPSRAPNGEASNPRAIVWPHDPYGFTSMLRKEGVRAAGRIKGDEAKLQLFKDTLRVLAQHGIAKIDTDKVTLAERERNQKVRIAAEKARAVKDAKLELRRLKEQVKSAEAAVAAQEGK